MQQNLGGNVSKRALASTRTRKAVDIASILRASCRPVQGSVAALIFGSPKRIPRFLQGMRAEEAHMAVCITGMHRSGTSMATHLLGASGLYLGPESDLLPPGPDNPEGFWENVHFFRINEEILNLLGGAWDAPPALPDGWENRPEFEPLQVRAEYLLGRFAGHEPWGWKDPRNCLTFAFWRKLALDIKVVVCVRNPLEVVHSLCKRQGFSVALTQGLWLTYYQTLLRLVPPENRIVTHYESYFADARAEVRRIADWLGLGAPDEAIAAACAAASDGLRHHRVPVRDLVRSEVSPATLELYFDLCDQAGPVYQSLSRTATHAEETATSAFRKEAGHADALRAQRFEVYARWVERRTRQEMDELAQRLVKSEHACQTAQTEAREHADAATRLTETAHGLAELQSRHHALEQEHRQLQVQHSLCESELARRSRETADLTEELARRSQDMTDMAGQLAEREETARALHRQVGDHGAALVALRRELTESQTRAGELSVRLAALEQVLTARQQSEHWLRAELEQREKQLERLQACLDGIAASRSWRLIHRVKRAGRLLSLRKTA